MQFKRIQSEQLDVNLTPLIDVVFLLLIFFMVSTTFTKETHLDINLPSSQAENPMDFPPEKIDVVITAEGKYTVNEQTLSADTKDALKDMIEEIAKGNNSLPFIITADGKTPHQSVINAMDIARQLGFGKINFATINLSEEL